MRKTTLILALATLGTASLLWTFRGEPERIAESRLSPDQRFRLVITVREEYFPYGVKGSLYITDSEGKRSRKVADYFTDGLGELDGLLKWDNKAKAFVYRYSTNDTMLIGPEYTPLDQ